MTSTRTKSGLWRYGAIAFFCGLPLLLLAMIWSNLSSATQAGEAAERQRATATAIIAQLEKHRARAARPVDTALLYLASASASLARAEIQQRATKLVEAAGGHIAEAQVTSTPEQETEGTVAVQLSLDIDNKGLLDLLYATETGLPLLDVTDLSARKNNGQTEGPPSDDGPLRVEMTVRGHWRKSTG